MMIFISIVLLCLYILYRFWTRGSEGAKLLVQDMRDNPDNYEIGEYHLVNIQTNQSYWIANGAAFLRQEVPYTYHFGYINALWIQREIRKLKEHKTKQQLGLMGDT